MPGKKRSTSSHDRRNNRRAPGSSSASNAATPTTSLPDELRLLPRVFIDMAHKEQRDLRARLQQLTRLEISAQRLQHSIDQGRVPKSLMMHPPTIVFEATSKSTMDELVASARRCAQEASLTVARDLLRARLADIAVKQSLTSINAARGRFVAALAQLDTEAVALCLGNETSPARTALMTYLNKLLGEVLLSHTARRQSERASAEASANRAAATMEASAELSTKDVIMREVRKAVNQAMRTASRPNATRAATPRSRSRNRQRDPAPRRPQSRSATPRGRRIASASPRRRQHGSAQNNAPKRRSRSAPPPRSTNQARGHGGPRHIGRRSKSANSSRGRRHGAGNQ